MREGREERAAHQERGEFRREGVREEREEDICARAEREGRGELDREGPGRPAVDAAPLGGRTAGDGPLEEAVKGGGRALELLSLRLRDCRPRV